MSYLHAARPVWLVSTFRRSTSNPVTGLNEHKKDAKKIAKKADRKLNHKTAFRCPAWFVSLTFVLLFWCLHQKSDLTTEVKVELLCHLWFPYCALYTEVIICGKEYVLDVCAFIIQMLNHLDHNICYMVSHPLLFDWNGFKLRDQGTACVRWVTREFFILLFFWHQLLSLEFFWLHDI